MDKILEQFLAIAEAGSYVAASEKLHVSQPALSYNLKKLEANLGVKLFERSSRGVKLTPYGETLYENALTMGRLYSNAVESIARQKAGREQGIKIGTGYSTWNLFFRDMIVQQFKENPQVPVNVNLGNELLNMDQLLAGEITLFVGHKIDNLIHENLVQFIPLGDVTSSYTVRQDHPLLGDRRSRKEILKYRNVQILTRDARQERLVSQSYEDGRNKLRELTSHDFISNSLHVCLEIVRETDAVLFHSRLFNRLLAERGFKQVELLPGESLSIWTMGIYLTKENSSDPSVRKIVDQLIENKNKILDLPAVELS